MTSGGDHAVPAPRRTLAAYYPRECQVECPRCKRSAVVDKYEMRRRFGDVTLQDCALKISALKGCALAGTFGQAQCSVRVTETPVWTWARLQEARIGGWSAYLTCHRRFAALKSSDSCPEVIRLDVLSMCAVLGDDFPLERLPQKCKCPQCGTASIEIEWRVPEPPKSPAPFQVQPPLRLRPRGAELARQKLGVAKARSPIRLISLSELKTNPSKPTPWNNPSQVHMFGFGKSKISHSDFGHLITNYVSDFVYNDAGRAIGMQFEDMDGSQGWRTFLVGKGIAEEDLVAYYRTFLHSAIQCSSKLLPEHTRLAFMRGFRDAFDKSPPDYDFDELYAELESELRHDNLDETNPFISHDFRIDGLPNPWSAHLAGEFVYDRAAAPILAEFNMRPGSYALVPPMASAITTTMRAGAQITKQYKLV